MGFNQQAYVASMLFYWSFDDNICLRNKNWRCQTTSIILGISQTKLLMKLMHQTHYCLNAISTRSQAYPIQIQCFQRNQNTKFTSFHQLNQLPNEYQLRNTKPHHAFHITQIMRFICDYHAYTFEHLKNLLDF